MVVVDFETAVAVTAETRSHQEPQRSYQVFPLSQQQHFFRKLSCERANCCGRASVTIKIPDKRWGSVRIRCATTNSVSRRSKMKTGKIHQTTYHPQQAWVQQRKQQQQQRKQQQQQHNVRKKRTLNGSLCPSMMRIVIVSKVCMFINLVGKVICTVAQLSQQTVTSSS